MKRLPRDPFLRLDRLAAWSALAVVGFGSGPYAWKSPLSCVYFARVGMSVKIGRSAHVVERARALTLQRGVEHRLVVVITAANFATERAIHRLLRDEAAGPGETFRGAKTEAVLATLCREAVNSRSAAA